MTKYGYIAVDLFFIMSGFILMYVHHRDFQAFSWERVWNFLLLRWWRTYPVHIATLGLALAITVVLGESIPDFGKLFESVLFIDTWTVGNSLINVPIWSLRVEWLGYFLFPILAFFIVRFGHRTAIAATIVISFFDIAVLVANDNFLMDVTTVPLSLCRMATGFVCGCLLWAMHDRIQLRGSFQSDLLMISTIAGIALIWLYSFPVYSFPLLLVVVSCAAVSGPWTTTLLTNKLALFVGRISFPLYMCHYPILKYVQTFQPIGSPPSTRLVYSLGAILLIILFATILCVYVEEPLRRYGRSLSPDGRNLKVSRS